MSKPYWNVFRTAEDPKNWRKVGVAFINRDGSYNMKLSQTIAATDKLQMRQALQRDKSKELTKERGAEASVA